VRRKRRRRCCGSQFVDVNSALNSFLTLLLPPSPPPPPHPTSPYYFYYHHLSGATLFPQQINLAATFNPKFAREMGRITAKDTVACEEEEEGEGRRGL